MINHVRKLSRRLRFSSNSYDVKQLSRSSILSLPEHRSFPTEWRLIKTANYNVNTYFQSFLISCSCLHFIKIFRPKTCSFSSIFRASFTTMFPKKSGLYGPPNFPSTPYFNLFSGKLSCLKNPNFGPKQSRSVQALNAQKAMFPKKSGLYEPPCAPSTPFLVIFEKKCRTLHFL